MTFVFRLRKHFDCSVYAPSRRTRLGDDGNALLLLRFLRRARSSRQLQHSRLLTLTEAGEPYNRPAGKLTLEQKQTKTFISRPRRAFFHPKKVPTPAGVDLLFVN